MAEENTSAVGFVTSDISVVHSWSLSQDYLVAQCLLQNSCEGSKWTVFKELFGSHLVYFGIPVLKDTDMWYPGANNQTDNVLAAAALVLQPPSETRLVVQQHVLSHYSPKSLLLVLIVWLQASGF